MTPPRTGEKQNNFYEGKRHINAEISVRKWWKTPKDIQFTFKYDKEKQKILTFKNLKPEIVDIFPWKVTYLAEYANSTIL